jgi:hypothetical protein
LHDTLSNWDLEKTIEDAKRETDSMQSLLDSINNPQSQSVATTPAPVNLPAPGATLDSELQRIMAQANELQKSTGFGGFSNFMSSS